MSKGVIAAASVFVGVLVGVGLVVPSKTTTPDSTPAQVEVEAPAPPTSPAAIVVPAAKPTPLKIAVKELSAKPPVDPIDPDPIPDPDPTPTTPSGTVGCQFPPIYTQWWLRPTDQSAYLAGLLEDTDYRTNLMFVWEGQFQHEIEAVSSNGVVLGSLNFDTYMLESCTPDNITYRDGVCSGMFQLNRFVTHIDKTYTGVYSVRVKPLGGSGKIFFYATVIDNRSDDCTTYTQFRRTKSNNMWAESGLYYQGTPDAETETP